MKLLKFIFPISISLVSLSAIIFLALWISLPSTQVLKSIELQEPLRIYTQEGNLIAEFGEIRRLPVTLDQVPQLIIDATLATEDQRFFTHSGVDIPGIFRAAIVLFTTGQKAQGGSTITMQVARNFFLSRKKSYWRKLKEILLSFKIEQELSKKEILTLYFNKIFYGNRAYGIAAAANTYYGKTLDQLSLSDIAVLVGLPKAPSKLNPLSYPEAALERRNHVLKRLLETGFIKPTDYETALKSSLGIGYHEQKVTAYAPYAAEMIRQFVVEKYGEEADEKGLKVYTTLDNRLQIAANQAISDGLMSYDKKRGYRGPESHQDKLDPAFLKTLPTINNLIPALVTKLDSQVVSLKSKYGESIQIALTKTSPRLKVGDIIRIRRLKEGTWTWGQIPLVEAALVAMNPNDGAIKALVGGFNFFKSNFNRITQAQRQPGSAFKPFIYAAALDKGNTLATILNDAPFAMQDVSLGGWWRPENNTKEFGGPIRLRESLYRSRNLVSIRLLQLIEVPYVIDYAVRFGFRKDQMPNTLSLALGTASVTPLEMARAYAVFANTGYLVEPYLISRVLDNKNNLLYQAEPIKTNDPLRPAPRVISEETAFLMNSALQDVIRFGTGQRAKRLNRRDLGGKTGTTNETKDTWFNGFNRNLIATVWMGFDEPRPLHDEAAHLALPIWIQFMQEALQGQPETFFPQPSTIISVRIDPKTGLLAHADDPHSVFEYFQKETAPKQYSPTEHELRSGSVLNELYR